MKWKFYHIDDLIIVKKKKLLKKIPNPLKL